MSPYNVVATLVIAVALLAGCFGGSEEKVSPATPAASAAVTVAIALGSEPRLQAPIRTLYASRSTS